MQYPVNLVSSKLISKVVNSKRDPGRCRVQWMKRCGISNVWGKDDVLAFPRGKEKIMWLWSRGFPDFINIDAGSSVFGPWEVGALESQLTLSRTCCSVGACARLHVCLWWCECVCEGMHGVCVEWVCMSECVWVNVVCVCECGVSVWLSEYV